MARNGTQNNETMTMAQELAALLDSTDDCTPGLTVRQTLCRAVVQQAMGGNFKMLEWLYAVSGEKQREIDMLLEIDRRKHPRRHILDDILDS